MPWQRYIRVARAARLGPPEDLVAALAAFGDSPADVAAMLRRHQLTSLVLDAVTTWGLDDEVDRALLTAIRAQRPARPVAAHDFLAVFADLRTRLHASGVPVLLLKGLYFAERLYGGYERRPQFDLDVLVHPRHRRLAGQTLMAMGFVRQTYDSHSVTFIRGALKVDVHGWLRRAPAYRISEDRLWSAAQPVRIGDLDVHTLSDEFNLVLMTLSAFQDLGQGMARVKQLLDLLLLLRDVDSHCDWDAFFVSRHLERTGRVIANVLALVVAVFDARDEVPHLARALDARHDWVGDMTRAQATALVFAERKALPNLEWFRRVYPGQFFWYLAWFWWGSFPQNLFDLDRTRLRTAMFALLRRT